MSSSTAIDRDRLPLEFRLPLFELIFPLVAFVPLALVPARRTSNLEWQWSVGFFAVLALLAVAYRRRWRLVLDDDGVAVTSLTTTRIPWNEVRGFERGSKWVGGLSIRTDQRVIHSVAPSSRWGGRISPEEVERLERIRRAHQS
jgi:hypothetical protein